jgi:hypothetical protein
MHGEEGDGQLLKGCERFHGGVYPCQSHICEELSGRIKTSPGVKITTTQRIGFIIRILNFLSIYSMSCGGSRRMHDLLGDS